MPANDGVVKPRIAGKGSGSTGVFTIPAYMMRAIPDGSLFRAEWNEDGILYRFLGDEDRVAQERPGWAQAEQEREQEENWAGAEV